MSYKTSLICDRCGWVFSEWGDRVNKIRVSGKRKDPVKGSFHDHSWDLHLCDEDFEELEKLFPYWERK